MIEVRDLSKHYGSHRAVDRISFDVAAGEIVGFLGPNGAGKTTTLRILTCFLPATSGSVRIAGHDVVTASMEVRQVVGYLPESNPLYPEMRVREYLRFRGKLHGLDRADREAAIARVTERCWLASVIDRPIAHLSKGFRQRVGLADALLHNPRVLILDEPTVGLDPAQIRETRSLIRELAELHTVVLSSHILPEVEVTCQRLVIIHEGRLVASGTPAELRQQISHESNLIVEVQAPSDAVANALRGLAGVTDVRVETIEGWARASVAAQSDVREQVYGLATGQGWKLRELRREVATLEDFFVKIVAGTRTAGQPADART